MGCFLSTQKQATYDVVPSCHRVGFINKHDMIEYVWKTCPSKLDIDALWCSMCTLAFSATTPQNCVVCYEYHFTNLRLFLELQHLQNQLDDTTLWKALNIVGFFVEDNERCANLQLHKLLLGDSTMMFSFHNFLRSCSPSIQARSYEVVHNNLLQHESDKLPSFTTLSYKHLQPQGCTH